MAVWISQAALTINLPGTSYMASDIVPETLQLVTRDQAVAQGLKRYFTGEPCSRGHISERHVSSKACLECAKENMAHFREVNPERAKAIQVKSESVNREKRVEKRRKSRVVLCPNCNTPIPPPELKPGAIRASRSRYCSKRCKLYSKVDKTPGHGPNGDCWVFTGATHKFGYGMINKSDSKDSDVTTAHAFSWEIEKGPIPEGLSVLHHCDHPPCVRPSHLFIGTHQDNMDDMMAKGRQVCGEKNGNAKLTESQVREIRDDPRSARKLSGIYGVSHQLVDSIKSGKRWKHLT